MGGGMSFAMIVVLAGLFGIVLWCANILRRSTTRPWKGVTAPSCGKCGYRVEGLATFKCPECGSDLREVGVVTPQLQMRGRGSTAGALVAWTVVVLLVLGWLSLRLAASVRGGALRPATVSSVDHFVPVDGAYTAIEFRMDGEMDSGGRLVSGNLDIVLKTKDKADRILRVTPNGFAPRVTRPIFERPDQTTPFDAASVESLFADAGLTNGSATRADCAPIYKFATDLLNRTISAGNGSMSGQFVGATRTITTTAAGSGVNWWGLAIAALPVGAWAWGAVWIVKRRRLLMREAGAAQAAVEGAGAGAAAG